MDFHTAAADGSVHTLITGVRLPKAGESTVGEVDEISLTLTLTLTPVSYTHLTLPTILLV